jgi:predicted P-loop ATPase
MKKMKLLHDWLVSLFPHLFQEHEKTSISEPVLFQPENRVSDSGHKCPETMPKATDAMLRMEQFLEKEYDFRFNLLTEETEFRTGKGMKNSFQPIGQRELNSFCIAARKKGIDCWDRDISRYIYSGSISEYHPFHLYMEELPEWDGTDRVERLARRVSADRIWVQGFYRWMLGMAAGWMEMDTLHANSVAPVLVSRRQGRQKSTFCKLLVPKELQAYYTDSFDLNIQGASERKLAEFGLINLDEFDKFSTRKMALLKNIMQMAGLNIRKAYRKSYRPLPRIASFIGTSNQKELLTDKTGSRRFLCVEIEDKIDCSPLDHKQLYAQLKAELLAGQRYWFTAEEEAEIMEANQAFYKTAVEEEVFYTCFRAAEGEEKALFLSATEIFRQLKKFNPSAMREASAANFGKVLTALGIERIHTEYGNRYRVVAVG